MRISADRTSPDYWKVHFDVDPTIKLDGEVLHYVTLADDVTGEVEFLVKDSAGRFYPYAGCFSTQKKRGRVEIIEA